MHRPSEPEKFLFERPANAWKTVHGSRLVCGEFWPACRGASFYCICMGDRFAALHFHGLLLFVLQVINTLAKCIMLYASADHSATQRTFDKPRTVKACNPRNAFKSAFTVSEVEARSL